MNGSVYTTKESDSTEEKLLVKIDNAVITGGGVPMELFNNTIDQLSAEDVFIKSTLDTVQENLHTYVKQLTDEDVALRNTLYGIDVLLNAFKDRLDAHELSTLAQHTALIEEDTNIKAALTEETTQRELQGVLLNENMALLDTSLQEKISYAIAELVADAPDSFDTLKEVATWIATHESDAAAFNAAIQQNKSNIEAETNTRIQEDTALATRLNEIENKEVTVENLADTLFSLLHPAGRLEYIAFIPTADWLTKHRRLICDGSAVSRTTYAELFTAIGTTYGTGNGSTTFNLPNLVDRMLYGKKDSTGVTGGVSSVTLSTANLPAHTHTLEHTHTLAHTHTLEHTHTLAHTHTLSHTHSMSHTHTFVANGVTANGVSYKLGGTGTNVYTYGSSTTSGASTSTTGAASTSTTSAASTTSTGAASTCTTSAASATTTSEASTTNTGSVGSGTAITTISPYITAVPVISY